MALFISLVTLHSTVIQKSESGNPCPLGPPLDPSKTLTGI